MVLGNVSKDIARAILDLALDVVKGDGVVKDLEKIRLSYFEKSLGIEPSDDYMSRNEAISILKKRSIQEKRVLALIIFDFSYCDGFCSNRERSVCSEILTQVGLTSGEIFEAERICCDTYRNIAETNIFITTEGEV